MQVEAGKSYFTTFSFFYYYFSYERVLEELALLKMKMFCMKISLKYMVLLECGKVDGPLIELEAA